MTFLESITTEPMLQRLRIAQEQRSDLDVILKMIGPSRRAEFLHALGPSYDDELRAMLPPVAPLSLRSITAQSSEEAYRWHGAVDINCIFALYEHFADGRMHLERRRVLDFGCGGGRLSRYVGLSQRYEALASEANPNHVQWCSTHLPNVTTKFNRRSPPLDFESESIDLVYAWSVFTHLPQEEAQAWLKDIARALRKGGMLIATIHSYTALETLLHSTPHQTQMRLTAQGACDIRTSLSQSGYVFLPLPASSLILANVGPDYGHTFIDVPKMSTLWNGRFKLLAHLEGRAVAKWQDALILLKL